MAADRVQKSIGYTTNMGDFESMRIDVSVASDVREGEKVREALARVTAVVEEELGKDMKKVNSLRGR